MRNCNVLLSHCRRTQNEFQFLALEYRYICIYSMYNASLYRDMYMNLRISDVGYIANYICVAVVPGRWPVCLHELYVNEFV